MNVNLISIGKLLLKRERKRRKLTRLEVVVVVCSVKRPITGHKNALL